MTTAELINAVASDTLSSKKTAAEIINALVKRMTAELKNGQDVVLQGIGKFTVKATAARTARNPITGLAVNVPAGEKVAFKIHKSLKDAVKAG